MHSKNVQNIATLNVCIMYYSILTMVAELDEAHVTHGFNTHLLSCKK